MWASSGSERLPLLRRSVEAARPDVLGLQEVLPSKLADVAELVAPLTLLPGPTAGPPRWLGVSTTHSERNRAGEHLPIAYRADRFERRDGGAFWSSATPGTPGSLLRLARTPFLVHWAWLVPREASGSLFIMNAHFGHAPWHHAPTTRIVTTCLRALLDRQVRIADTDEGVFLVGDFNAVPSSRLLSGLTSRSGPGFVDAARSAARRTGPPVTFHWGRGATRLGLTLDYVLARTPMHPVRAEVIDVREGRLHASDHHLLVVEFDRHGP